MFNIGAGELIFIMVAALIVLGPQRLPEFARAIGKFVREFRRQTDDVRMTVEREFYKMDQEFQDEPRPPVPMGFPSTALSSLPPPQPVPSLSAAPAVPAVPVEAPASETPAVVASGELPVANDPSKSG
ncbi:Sec-independent protein translocase protein TatB [Melittangium boletus]|uniref:Protein translocase TatA n=1 Tax=Melittangium boletus DSM 14713 TaxID=1294270 RepID=A0A250IAF9_9BACT|nr:Sec-independent protein translocase protein TatB [Melittangium boletus]ATB28151.1 protein translocase TatA [Melittangium boletus DSM 14713]